MTEFYLEHGDQEHSIPATQPLTVGSGEACGLRLQAEGVEQEHAVVRVEGDRVILDSRIAGEQDVRVNGVAVHAAALESGDTVQFGDVEATFEMADGDPKLTLPDGTRDLVRGVNAIGRDPDGGIELDDESVSRKHAALLILPSGQILIRDLGSANGTTVNDRRLGEIELKQGDEVRLGEAVLHLRQKKGVAASPPVAAGPVGATVVKPRPDAPQPAGESPSAAKLELEFRGQKRQLGEGVVRIGRATDCEIVIDDDAQVSRHHAEVEVSGSLVMLRDLGSSNGTRLNDEAITRATPLQNGDRIGIGGQELTYTADVPVTPFGQTMVAKELPGAAGRTAVAPPPGGGKVAASESVTPTDRQSALQLLELGSDAGEEQIQQRYRELYSEFQIRLTNAPTAELKATYKRRLDDLGSALAILQPQAAAGSVGDLPALHPGQDTAGPAGSSAPDDSAGGAVVAPTEAGTARAASDDAPAGTSVGEKLSGGLKGLPRSTLVVGGVGALLLVAVIVSALGALRAGAVTAGLKADLESRTTEFEELESAIPETQVSLEELRQGKGQLVEQNLELKICNHSSAPLTWMWLNVARFDAENGRFVSFDTAYNTEWEYLYYTESIPPDGAFAGGGWVVGEQRVWDGTALFFAARFDYRGEEILRAGAMPAFGGDCYPLNLDR